MTNQNARGFRQSGRMVLSMVLSSALLVPAAQGNQCLEQGLVAPMGYHQITETRSNGNYQCERVLPHTGSMNFTSKYSGSDGARNELNDDAYQEYLEASKNIRNFEKIVIAGADDFQVDGDGSHARDCVMDNLDEWATANALLSDDINHVGQAVRKWALAAASNAYLRVQKSSVKLALDQEQSQRIEAWFRKLSQGVQDYYSDREPRKVNNHDYWAAWAVMSSAVATQECGDWSWALGKFDEAMGQITAEGYLPKELSREDRALEYLNYAIQPLTMMAVFAEANGNSLYERYRSRFLALASNVVAGLENPQEIASLTGHSQLTGGLYTPWGIAWMRPWSAAWEEVPGMATFLEEYGPAKNTRLGGDLAFLYAICPPWPASDDPQPPGNIRISNR